MRRNIKKQIWMNKKEAQLLQKKARKACLTEAALIRLLIQGYEPREKPDERFYDEMKLLRNIASSLNQIAAKANSIGFIDSMMLEDEVKRLHRFEADIEKAFILPAKGE